MPNTFCRVCASSFSEDELVNIFETHYHVQTVAEMIHELTRLVVKQDDGLPSVCCIPCQSDVLCSVETRRKCIISEEALKTKFEDDELKQLDISDNIEHQTSDIIEGRFKETTLTNNDSEEAMSLDIDESIASSPSGESDNDDDENEALQPHQYVCSGCGVFFDIKERLDNHLRLCKADLTLSEKFDDKRVEDGTPSVEQVRSSPPLELLVTPPETEKTTSNDHHHQEKSFPESEDNKDEKTVMKKDGLSKESSETDTEDTNDSKIGCCGCNMYFDTEDALKEHSLSVHAQKKMIAHKSKPFQCQICYSSYTTLRNLRDHQFYMRNRPFKCTICDMRFGRLAGLNLHMKSHSRNLIYPCKLCDKTFYAYHRRRTHMKKEHSGDETIITHDTGRASEKYKCCGCTDAFDTKDELQDHGRTVHAPNAPLGKKSKSQCNICYRWYKTELCVRAHQREVYSHRYQCATCGKKFNRPSYLTAHENLHTLSYMCRCDDCDKTFTNRSAMYQHKKLFHKPHYHEPEEEPKHICTKCDKSFKSDSYLQNHIKLHADDTPYKCHCGAQFKLKLYLRRHMHIHSGNFICKFCFAAFPCTAVLKEHENHHTNNREFSCPICGKCFCSKAKVNRHKRTVHQKKVKHVKKNHLDVKS